MKSFFIFWVMCIALVVSTANAEKIRVVASIPDVADMARRIGGERVEVTSLAKGVEDPHAIPMKPSFVVLLNKADVLAVQGLGLEHAFLPGLLEVARNQRIMPGSEGYVDLSAGIIPLDVPTQVTRAEGEQHPDGNPHINLNPENGRRMAENLARALSGLYPQFGAEFTGNLVSFQQELDKNIIRWKEEGKSLKGAKFVSYHADLAYLAQFFGMVSEGTIELKPGVPPTASHIAELSEHMKKAGVKLIIRERHYPVSIAETLGMQTGASVADVSVMTGGSPEQQDYISFVEGNLRALLNPTGTK